LDGPAPGLADVSGQPPELCELVDSCLAPAPADRPAAVELMGRLERIAAIPAREQRFQREISSRVSGPFAS
jgi:hypothetical protein